jgi:hypothetical protein
MVTRLVLHMTALAAVEQTLHVAVVSSHCLNEYVTRDFCIGAADAVSRVCAACSWGVGVQLLRAGRCFWSGCWAPLGIRALGVSCWWRQCHRPPTIRFA